MHHKLKKARLLSAQSRLKSYLNGDLKRTKKLGHFLGTINTMQDIRVNVLVALTDDDIHKLCNTNAMILNKPYLFIGTNSNYTLTAVVDSNHIGTILHSRVQAACVLLEERIVVALARIGTKNKNRIKNRCLTPKAKEYHDKNSATMVKTYESRNDVFERQSDPYLAGVDAKTMGIERDDKLLYPDGSYDQELFTKGYES